MTSAMLMVQPQTTNNKQQTNSTSRYTFNAIIHTGTHAIIFNLQLKSGAQCSCAQRVRCELSAPRCLTVVVVGWWCCAGCASFFRLPSTVMRSPRLQLFGCFVAETVAGGWSDLPPMLSARNNHRAAWVASPDRLIVAGGNTGQASFCASCVFASAESFQSGTWTSMPSMQSKRAGFASATIAGKLYVAGGTADLGDADASSAMFSTNTWKALPSMSRARANTAGGELKGKFVVVGGLSGPGLSRDAEAFDPSSNSWAPAGQMATAREGHAVVTQVLPSGSHRLVVIGGYGGPNYEALSTCETFDGTTWTAFAAMQVPRHGPAAASANGKIYAAGGSDISWKDQSSVEVYDPVSAAWAFIAPMRVGRTKAAAIAVNTQFFVTGGSFEGEDLSSVEVYDQLSPSPPPTKAPKKPTKPPTKAAPALDSSEVPNPTHSPPTADDTDSKSSSTGVMVVAGAIVGALAAIGAAAGYAAHRKRQRRPCSVATSDAGATRKEGSANATLAPTMGFAAMAAPVPATTQVAVVVAVSAPPAYDA